MQLLCDRSIRRYLSDRGKLSAVSCVSSFVQEHASEQKETATLHNTSVGKATVVPVTACASSLKQLHVASTFGSKDITREAVAMRLSSSDALDARNGFKELRPIPVEVSKCGVCSFFQRAERGLKDNGVSPSKMSFRCSVASLRQAPHASTTPSKHSSTLQPCCLTRPEPSLPGVCQQERSARRLGGQGLFSETTPSGQLLVGDILRTFPGERGYKRTVSVRTKNGVFKRPLAKLASRPQLRTIDARLGCKMDCSFFTETVTVAANHGLTFFAGGAWTLSEQTSGESAWLCLGGERLAENISNCSMLYVHVASSFTGKNCTPASCNCVGA